MKLQNKVTFPILILFAVIITISIMPGHADHATATVSIPTGTNTPGCEKTNACFSPYEVTVDVGGEVTWNNNDSTTHTVTSGTPADGPDGVFNSNLFMSDAAFSHKFEEVGTYTYFCMVHPWMEGIVVVQAEGEEAIDEKAEGLGESSGEIIEEAGEVTEDTVKETGDEVNHSGEKTDALNKETEKTEVSRETNVASQVSEETSEEDEEIKSTGGCLIATATYGSELAPQVQFLREIRDGKVMSTQAGAVFMTGFNQMYYSFSPTVADMERESPVLKETVKLIIAPMLSSLSIMTLADEGSETQVLSLGISVIALNLGMYVAVPTITSVTISKRLKSRKSNR